MVKTKRTETEEWFDEKGNLLRRTVTETEEVDDNPTAYMHTSTPVTPKLIPFPFCPPGSEKEARE